MRNKNKEEVYLGMLRILLDFFEKEKEYLSTQKCDKCGENLVEVYNLPFSPPSFRCKKCNRTESFHLYLGKKLPK